MLSLFFFLVSSLGCVLAANVIRCHSTEINYDKIVDIVHYNVPKLKLPYVSDTMVLIQTVGSVVVLQRDTISEFFAIMAIAQLFRIATMVSTILPPLKNYHDKYRLGGINGTGTEYIFSGHACYSALSAIYLYSFGIVPLWALIVYNILSQSLIIVSRNHYTVDVVLAWIIIPLIYGNLTLCKQVPLCNETIRYLF